MLLLAGCMGTFHTDQGSEPVRSALWFDARALEGVTDPAVPRDARVLLLNSTLPCRPEEVEDDPSTVGSDEAASAIAFWQAQAASAFTREDALVVAFGLYTYEPDWEGYYPIEETARYESRSLLSTTSRVAAAAWFRVQEVAVEESDGVYATYVATEMPEFDDAVAAPAWLRIAERDETLTGEWSFTPSELSGSFHAEKCDNRDLYQEVENLAVAVSYF